jgi:2-aminoadipate transaminase
MGKLSGNATREILKLIKRGGIISFAGGLPAGDMLPSAELAAVTAEILNSPRVKEVMQYDVTEGAPETRAEIAEYLGGFGVRNIGADDVQIVSGGQQGIDLACRALLDKGDYALVENPTYLAALQIVASCEAEAIGVKAAAGGLDLNDLEDKIKKYNPKLLYVVPTFSNPTGGSYSADNRKRIAELTARYGVVVVEDDPYAKLRFTGEAVPSIKSTDKAGNVIYLTSFSKIVSPGMRIGAACAAPDLLRRMTVCKQGIDVHTNSLSVAVIGEFLKRGIIARHVEKVLPIYKKKQKLIVECLDRYMPACYRHTDPEGGLFIWGRFEGAKIDTQTLLPEAIETCKAAYVQGNVFYADDSGHDCLRLNFSNPSETDIERGIKGLGSFFKKKI